MPPFADAGVCNRRQKGKKEIFDLFPEGIRGDSISPTN
jgi:hypothetical protein